MTVWLVTCAEMGKVRGGDGGLGGPMFVTKLMTTKVNETGADHQTWIALSLGPPIEFQTCCAYRTKGIIIHYLCLEEAYIVHTKSQLFQGQCQSYHHSGDLRIRAKPAVVSHTPSTRARAISQLLLQPRVLLLQSLNLSLIKSPQILLSIACFAESLQPH
jgi:hypothetical protein